MPLPNPEELIKEILEHEAARIRSEIHDRMFYREARPYVHQGGFVYPDYLPKGTVDLLSPAGELLMRNGELVEKRKRRFK